jgi:quinoprotein glucose dehydrogenase
MEMHHNQSRLGDQYTRMHGTPYVMRRRILRSGTGLDLPCAKPPWGALVAIDLKTGARAWEVPLGDPSTMRPEFAKLSATPLGTPNLGGPIVTAGGVVFIGATMDRLLRAFDVESGRELWKGMLPGGARATPMTYEINGRQFVSIAVGGSEDWGKGDRIVTFALPK